MSMGGHAQAAHAVGIRVNQKLDKSLLLFIEQKSETADLKKEVTCHRNFGPEILVVE